MEDIPYLEDEDHVLYLYLNNEADRKVLRCAILKINTTARKLHKLKSKGNHRIGGLIRYYEKNNISYDKKADPRKIYLAASIEHKNNSEKHALAMLILENRFMARIVQGYRAIDRLYQRADA